jgi:hypothetical protein
MSTQRWKAQVSVSLVARNQTSLLLTDSVSLSSIFVRTDAPPPPMALLRLEFRLPPDDVPLVIHGVARVQRRFVVVAAGERLGLSGRGARYVPTA